MILPEWSIRDLNEKMEAGELTARQVADLFLQRIEAVDKSGPYINSVIELNPDVLEIADNLDKERAAGKVIAPTFSSCAARVVVVSVTANIFLIPFNTYTQSSAKIFHAILRGVQKRATHLWVIDLKEGFRTEGGDRGTCATGSYEPGMKTSVELFRNAVEGKTRVRTP